MACTDDVVTAEIDKWLRSTAALINLGFTIDELHQKTKAVASNQQELANKLLDKVLDKIHRQTHVAPTADEIAETTATYYFQAMMNKTV